MISTRSRTALALVSLALLSIPLAADDGFRFSTFVALPLWERGTSASREIAGVTAESDLGSDPGLGIAVEYFFRPAVSIELTATGLNPSSTTTVTGLPPGFGPIRREVTVVPASALVSAHWSPSPRIRTQLGIGAVWVHMSDEPGIPVTVFEPGPNPGELLPVTSMVGGTKDHGGLLAAAGLSIPLGSRLDWRVRADWVPVASGGDEAARYRGSLWTGIAFRR